MSLILTAVGGHMSMRDGALNYRKKKKTITGRNFKKRSKEETNKQTKRSKKKNHKKKQTNKKHRRKHQWSQKIKTNKNYKKE